ncbi:hypothetical protein [Pedosphaera parvula]|uniref:Lipoprotein n=1 Tax=Pedosphaera parvula (strain Ellin514) TaxID=320771 RepID=B9XF70_PEDPL|nr:hypothetical protein [Pedosphaera parvula]EEF61568.1 hypothetical protein Cflav_PD4246 [Pedosphaera parvula Ellin514]
MKYLNRWLWLSSLTLLPACAFHAAPVASLAPVGPAPHVASKASKEGYLLVYSAWEPFRLQDSRFDRHSNYKLLSSDGRTVQNIKNCIDRFDDNPVCVALVPGSYQVSARSAHSGRVTVPVLIQEGETTCVYLDGSNQPQTAPAADSTLVKLPNGQVVGWAAKEEKENSVVASSRSQQEKAK